MDKSSLISQWLTKPDTFTANDQEELNTLIGKFPYFIPARYIEAANHHKHLPFEPGMMSRMQLFQGNWLLFYEHLDACEVFFQKQVADNEAPLIQENTLPITETPTENAEPEVATVMESYVSSPDLPTTPLQEIPVVVMEQGQPLEEIPFTAQQPLIQEEVFNKVESEVDLTAKTEEATEAQQENSLAESIPEPTIENVIPEPVIETKPLKEVKQSEELLKPLYSEDYFLYQGIEIPEITISQKVITKEDKSLMVMMSFSEWLMHFKTKNERDKQEKEDKKAIKSMWQKEKLAAALEEENEVIPENVFNMAVNSITKEENLASESLAEVLHKQGKLDKAIDMYNKLSLLNPQKKAYFAAKIDQINKQIES